MLKFKKCYYDYVRKGSKDKIYGEALPLIKKTFNFPAQLPPHLGIIESPREDYTHFYCRRTQLRGGYDYTENSIILYHGKYCRKTVIHETLHAASYFAYGRFSELFDKLRIIIEGLTEFLTGYILYRNFKTCYREWLKCESKVCQISYKDETRLFGALARYISISELAALYLWQPEVDWYQKYHDFLAKYSIEEVLLTGKKKIPMKIRFYIALRKAFGPKIHDLAKQAPLDDCLNYSQMKR